MFEQDRPIGLRRSTAPLTETKIEPSEPLQGMSRPVQSAPHLALAEMQHPKETPFFMACAIVSLILYPLLIIGVHVLIPILFLVNLCLHGFMTGQLKGNCIRVSRHQLPQVFHATEAMSARLGLEHVPAVYVMESGGMLNAFASRFLKKDYVVLFSNVVEMAYEQGPEALDFVLAHELAHIARRHLRNRWMILPAEFLPLLPQAYYRACEYSCDLIAAHCAPQGAVSGLMALSAGKKLRHHVSATEFAAQVETETGFWVWLTELFASHPNLPKRVEAVINLRVVQQALNDTPLTPPRSESSHALAQYEN